MTPGALAWHLGATISLVTVLWPVDGGWLVMVVDSEPSKIIAPSDELRPAFTSQTQEA